MLHVCCQVGAEVFRHLHLFIFFFLVALSSQGHLTEHHLNQRFPSSCLDSCFQHQILLPSPPSACNIHLGECCHDETHILMLTRTLPRALFTAQVTYHQIKAASEGWKYEQARTVFTIHNTERDKITGLQWTFSDSCSAVSKHAGFGSVCWWSSLDTELSGPLFGLSQMFLPLCACVWGRECAGWYSP